MWLQGHAVQYDFISMLTKALCKAHSHPVKVCILNQNFLSYCVVFPWQLSKWPMNILRPTHAQVHRERKCQVNKWTCLMRTHRPKQFLWCPSERLLAISPCWKVEKLRTSWNVSYEWNWSNYRVKAMFYTILQVLNFATFKPLN